MDIDDSMEPRCSIDIVTPQKKKRKKKKMSASQQRHVDRIRKAAKRASETDLETETRRDKQRRYTAQMRAQETEEEGEARRANLRQHKNRKWAEETEEEGDQRRANLRQHKNRKLAEETEEEGDQRRANLRQHKNRKLAEETEEEGDQRRANLRQHKNRKLAEETEEEGDQRRANLRQHKNRKLAEETEEEGDQRRANLRQHKNRKWAEETEEEGDERRAKLRQHENQMRAQETEEEGEERRANMRQRHTIVRAGEDDVERARRLADMTERMDIVRNQRLQDALDTNKYLGCIKDVMYFDETDFAQPGKALPTHRLPNLMDNNRCEHCDAYTWDDERPGFCCEKGKVHLDPLPLPPLEMRTLYNRDESQSKPFLKDIRKYNNMLALASIGCNERIMPGYSPTVKIHGKVYHRIGALHPGENEVPKFAQLYFHDTENEVNNRLHHCRVGNDGRHIRSILTELQTCLHRENSYVRSLKSAINFSEEQELPELQVVLEAKRRPAGEHARRYNLPTASEVAVIMPGEHIEDLDVVLQTQTGEVKYINTLHRSYDPLHYILLFPMGTDGYTEKLPYTDNRPGQISIIQYYCYRLQVRPPPGNYLMMSRRLTQQYVCDMWAKAEGHRLRFIRENQKEIRADKYNGLLDAVDANDEIRAGKRYILPATVYGSPRWYSQAFHDAMARVRAKGKPHYFITFTCNPRWPEIQGSLFPGESVDDRPDLCVRVFNLKKAELFDDLLKKQILGKVDSYFSMKEDQKRGLPHIHILLIMDQDDIPRNPEDVDRVICAEIPDREKNPELYAIITKSNIHGACGRINRKAPCMSTDGTDKCTKNFPKEYRQRTFLDDVHYPEYRRRSPEDGGATYVGKGGQGQFTYDNRWVVPYNPYLSLKYGAHINVEVVHCLSAVKYLYKYLTKGSDRVMVRLANGEVRDITYDEIARYVNARYISCSEAYWRIYQFLILDAYPPVEKLPLHLKDEQTVFFNEANAREVANRPAPTTKLTAYFQLNEEDPSARELLYPDIYRHYRYDGKKWVKRKRRQARASGELAPVDEAYSEMIGRIPMINFNAHQSEQYYLRMLLYNKPGATSFEDLRTIEGEEQPTYQAACCKIGLLDDDTEIDRAMEEAADIRFGKNVLEVFATILIFIKPSDPLEFWNRHRDRLCRELVRGDAMEEPSEATINAVLLDIKYHLERHGLDMVTKFKLPCPDERLVTQGESRIVREELEFDIDVQGEIADDRRSTLNEDQLAIFTTVMGAINSNHGLILALDAPGGTGKTYLLTTLLAEVRRNAMVALATAISGIAATLLPNGRTLHSRCKVPFVPRDDSTCSVSKRDSTAELMRRCKLFVIDEVTMAHRHVYEAVDRTFRDIREDDRPFGGCVVVLSGDWRQILPVVKRGGPADIIDACLKSSSLWQHVTTMRLHRNMRVENATRDRQQFADYLLDIGDGKVDVVPELGPYKIKLSDAFLTSQMTLAKLCDFVFRGLRKRYRDSEWLCSCSILCPTNDAANDVNTLMLRRFPGKSRVYKSADKLIGDEDRTHEYPVEFLNTIALSGLPPHQLELKIGMPIMLLRNLDPVHGHCNGTRYVVKTMHDHIIEATVAIGVHKGKDYFIPRIPLTPSETVFPFEMQRRQFPVRACFGMTANKAQGQTLSRIGIYIKKDFFAHGQLYVAMSRVGDPNKMRIVTKTGKQANRNGTYTNNVVYKEIL